MKAGTIRLDEKPILIETLRAYGKPATANAFREQLGIAYPELDENRFDKLITRMKADGTIVRTGSRRIALPEQVGIIRGRLQGNAKGFAFFIPEDGTRDLFIPPEAMGGAMNSDKVLVRKKRGKSGESDCGEVVRVLERANRKIVGRLEDLDNGAMTVVSCDKRISATIKIPKKWQRDAKAGDHAVVEIMDYDKLIGKVTEVLSDENDIDAAVILRQFDVPGEFPASVLKEAERAPVEVARDEALKREDLRGRVIVTIDGADAKDLDDAVSLEKLGGGKLLLGVHIADVSHYVTVGSALDQEALSRATSVYFPGSVVPMLPKELSNGICSLHGGVDRLALSCFMEIDRSGKVVDYRFAETVINTSARLTYDGVSEFLDGGKSDFPKPVKKLLKDMAALRDVLYKRRIKEGSLDFAATDTKVKMENGVPVEVCREEYGIANGIVEEFMLLCNKTVARHMSKMSLPCMYRVHELPESSKLQDFKEFMKTIGRPIKSAQKLTPKLIQEVLSGAKDTPEELVINKLVLRLMKKARYSEENLGHFGLAFNHYAHFTSPIRRYPDLMVHRVLKQWMHGGLTEERTDALRAAMPAMAIKCSEREKLAEDAERAMDDLRKCQYMRDKVGETYSGIISGMSNAGIFVELPSSVEGMIPFSSMQGDYYAYDPKRLMAIGGRSKQVFRLGELLTVRVMGVDFAARRVEFVLVRQPRRKTRIR